MYIAPRPILCQKILLFICYFNILSPIFQVSHSGFRHRVVCFALSAFGCTRVCTGALILVALALCVSHQASSLCSVLLFLHTAYDAFSNVFSSKNARPDVPCSLKVGLHHSNYVNVHVCLLPRKNLFACWCARLKLRTTAGNVFVAMFCRRK